MPEPERIDRRRTALIAYDARRRALTPPIPLRATAIRPASPTPGRDMIAAARAAGVPVIYTTPVSRADGADVVMLPTDLRRRPAHRRSPTASRGRPGPASPTRSPRGPRITSSSSVARAHFTGRGRRRTTAHAAARHCRHWRRCHQSWRRDKRPRGLQSRPRDHRGARVLLGRRRRGPGLQPRQGDENTRASEASTRSSRCYGTKRPREVIPTAITGWLRSSDSTRHNAAMTEL